MKNNIIEYCLQSKTGNMDECEDIIVVTQDFYAVIDGVTSKFPVKYQGKTAGRYCAELLKQAIEALPKDINAEDALELLDKAVSLAYGDKEITVENKLQASIIIYSKARRQVWSYGDCQLMINERIFDHKKIIDKTLENLRALTILAYLNEGGERESLFENDIGRESIMPYLKKQAQFANSDGYFGYAVIDGTGINKSLMKVYTVEKGDNVILASDGYPRLFKTLSESEKYLKWVLERDPLCICENIQTKMKRKENQSFDDRSYLSFTVE
jgi:hypothetical protein